MAYLLINGAANKLVVNGNNLKISGVTETILKVVVAKQNISFASAGLNASNTEIIYKVGAVLQSYVPGRSINPINGFELNKGYYWVLKSDISIDTIVAPPL